MTGDGVLPGPWFSGRWSEPGADDSPPVVMGPDVEDPEGDRWVTHVATGVANAATADFIADARTSWPIDQAALADLAALVDRAVPRRPRRWWRRRPTELVVPVEWVLAVLTARAHAYATVPLTPDDGPWATPPQGTLPKPTPVAR